MLVLLSVMITSKLQVYVTALRPLPVQEYILVNTHFPRGEQTCRRVFIANVPVMKSRENCMLNHQHKSGFVVIISSVTVTVYILTHT